MPQLNGRWLTCVALFGAVGLGGISSSPAEEAGGEESAEAELEEGAEASGQTDSGSDAEGDEADPEESSEKPGISSFRPGRVDATGAIGLGGLLYVTLEPGVDVSLVPLGDGVTLSVGGTLGVGYCLLCGVVNAATGGDFSVTAWNLAPQGRALVHFDALGEAVGAQIDAFTGASLGPNTYFFGARSGGVRLNESITTFVFTPLFGARIFGKQSGGFFGFGELRYRTEWGFSRVTLEAEEWNQRFVWDNSFARSGFEFIFGGGFRF